MPDQTNPGNDRLGTAARPRYRLLRPRLERLEERENPAASLVTAGPALAGADAPVQVLGTSDDGSIVLLQSTATNIIPGQIDVPGTTDLFYFNRATGAKFLITAFDPPAGSLFTPGTKAVGASISTPGVRANAVLSSDGSAVAFMSGTGARNFNSALAPVVDGGGEDLFVWNAATQKVVLGSQDKNGFSLGSFSLVSNPSISTDGKSFSFVSTTSAYYSYDNKYVIANTPQAIPTPAGFPNLFRSAVGAIPVPVTYTRFTTTTQGVIYPFFDNVSVDPLGRYASGDEVSFVVLGPQNRGFNSPGLATTPGTGNDAIRLSFAGAGFNNAPDSVVVSTTVLGNFLGGDGLGNVNNAIIARDRGDIVVFDASITGGVVYPLGFFTFGSTGSTNLLNAPVFDSGALVPGYVNGNGGGFDLYRSAQAGASANISLLSAAAGSASIGSDGVLDTEPDGFSVTPDGGKTVFTSSSDNLVANLTDRNRAFDVFQRDANAAATTAVSVTSVNANRTGFGGSRRPTQTTDGLVVAFESAATDLTGTPDTNGGTDIVVRDLGRKITSLASIVPGAFAAANAPSVTPVLGGSFRTAQLFFVSAATDLDATGKLSGAVPQVFVTTLPLVANGATRVVAYSGGVGGNVTLGTTDVDGNIISTKVFRPFGNFTGEIRVATGDVTGDGVPDLIVGAGTGGGPRVQVINGLTGRVVQDFFAFESSFTGGVYVGAGNFTGDARSDIIVGAGETGGPRVQIYDGATGRVLVDRFAFEPTARTGVHVAAGDYDGNGTDDLMVAAGVGGGPRVRVFSGNSTTVLNDFFAFDSGTRSGAYISAGDFDGDGKADLVAGTGPGIGTEVRIYNAANLALRDPNQPITFRDFFPYGEGDTGGARAVLRDIQGQANRDIVLGNASGLPNVRTYSGNTFGTSASTPQVLQEFTPFNELIGAFGAYVG